MSAADGPGVVAQQEQGQPVSEHYPHLTVQHVEFSLFEPDWQVAQVRYDYTAKLTDNELDTAHLVQVALRYDSGDEWDEIPCESIDLTARIAKRLLTNDRVWFYDRGMMSWRQTEFGDLLRRSLQSN